jgi:hypothetical protein
MNSSNERHLSKGLQRRYSYIEPRLLRTYVINIKLPYYVVYMYT